MSDITLSENEPVRAAQKYDPVRDRQRMKLYMQRVRTKNKAGFSHLTVGQWLKETAKES